MSETGKMYLHYFTDDKNFPFYVHYGYHDDTLEMHTHEDYVELVIVLDGTALHKVNSETYFVKKGDVFVIDQGVSHGYHDTNKLRICNVMFHPDLLLEQKHDLGQLPGFHALFVLEPYLSGKEDFKSRLSLNLTNFEQIQSLLDLMVNEYQSGLCGKRTLIESYFLILVTLLSRLYSLPAAQEITAPTLNIAKSVSYMESHFTESLSIDEIAEVSNLSSRHFSRLFTATYHLTPGNYLLSLRMQYAASLIRHSRESISEIAFSSGFNDSNYFSRQFHKYFGMTPREYRNRL
ncbi:MAG: helix-turn-helix domain-containing protein [Lachnospiraceae bacterium]|nr:helix-turn-helix domain-containing protein [Lachnospiraceae bacterium]